MHRYWGARGDAFLRILSSKYADNHSRPRQSIGSHVLPAAESIVKSLQKSINETIEHPHITAMLPAWGQLLAYDLVQIISPNSTFKCCENPTDLQCYVQKDNCKEYKRSVPSMDFSSCNFRKYSARLKSAKWFTIKLSNLQNNENK